MFMRDYFLYTDRIAFSHWAQTDYDLAILLWGDEVVTKYISKTGKFTEREIIERVNTEIKNEEVFRIQYWPIFEKETEDFIGCCGLRPYRIEDYVYEIGFHLRTKYWGQGFATEAALATIRHAFNNLNAATLFAGHHPNNTDSEKVLRKLEFEYIGDEYYEPTGLYHPSYRYSPH